jgi:AcrR family transcriptional regulator
MDAALQFLWFRPFREMSVNALMATTQVSRPAFYQYFDDVHELMETLLGNLEREILDFVKPWLECVGDPVTVLEESLAELVRICHEHGPFLQALDDASGTDARLEKAWADFLGRFDDAVTARIEADQEQGLIPKFEARPVAVALNRMDAAAMIQAFGQHPRSRPEPVLGAIRRIWKNTLYGSDPTQAVDRIRRVPDRV